MNAPGTLAIVLAIAIPAALFRAYRVTDAYIAQWAADRGLELTAESRGMVARYVRRAQIFRTWGAVTGAVLPTVTAYVFDDRVQVLGFGTDGTSAPLGFGSIFVGYLVGALVAEASLVRPRRSAKRVASLSRRELENYLPRRLIAAQRAAAVAGAAGTFAATLVPMSVDGPSTGGAIAMAAGALLFGPALEALERWLVRRPQPFAQPTLIAADDAVRAQSIRAVAGAGLAIQLLYCCGISLVLQASEVDSLQVLMVVPAIACLVLSLIACSSVTNGAWRVRRPGRPAPA